MVIFQGIKDTVDSCLDVDLRGSKKQQKRGCFMYDKLTAENKSKFDAMAMLLKNETLSLTGFGSLDSYFDISINKDFSGDSIKDISELSQKQIDTINDFINMTKTL